MQGLVLYMKVMFWNVHKNPNIDQAICNIVWNNDINIIILAEYVGNVKNLKELLEKNNRFVDKYVSEGCQKILILGDVMEVQPGTQNTRYSIQIIRNEYILCAMHLPSQLYGDSGQRRIIIRSIVEDIQELEMKLKSNRTIIVGDMNEDPFDDGCLSADNFHGIPTHADAAKNSRIILGQEFSMFYNPMWNLFGDFTSPPGTCYYPRSDTKCSFWHIFDQVMIRPCLRSEFVEDSLKIVTKAGIDSLLNRNGHPDKRFSDHLPIVFEIKEAS